MPQQYELMVKILSIIHVAIQTDVNSSKQKNTIKTLDHKNTRLGFQGNCQNGANLIKNFRLVMRMQSLVPASILTG